MIHSIFYYFPPLLWMAFLFPTNETLTTGSTSHIIVPVIRWFLPHAAQPTIDMLHILIRKTVHFLEYAFLALLWVRAFRGKSKEWRVHWILYAGFVAVVYAGLDEFLQTRIPARSGSVHDWMIDAAGALCATGILYFVKIKIKIPCPQT